MTIYDIAEAANVSTATVSRYLNGTGYVGRASAARIEAVIRESGYKPSGVAKLLSSGEKLRLVGVVCRDVEDPYYARAVSVIERQLRENGYEIILSCAGETTAEKKAAVATLLRKSAEAVIFIGSVFMDGDGAVIRETARHTPCFVINADVSGDNIYSAYCDDAAAVRACAEAMLAEGRTALLYLTDVDTYGSRQKLAGFRAAGGTLTAGVPRDFDGAAAAFPALYRQYRPDGVLCANDTIAAAVLSAARGLGLSVPGTLAVAGHNNSIVAKCAYPSLTSVDNGVDVLSRTTAENVVAFFSGRPVPRTFRADFSLIRRQSF